MAGSGGSYLRSGDLSQLRQEAIDSSLMAGEEARINELLESQLAEVDQRDVRTVRDRLDLLQEVLEDLIEDKVDLIFGGSVAKHTYVDGLSDVDSLVVLRPEIIGVSSPHQLVEDFGTALRERLGDYVQSVDHGRMAVSITFRDGGSVDLLPATRRSDHVAIPSEDGREWSEIRPLRFARKLSDVNERVGGRLFKTIKLAKALLTALPQGRRLTGYHVESLAIEAFESYEGSRSPREMLSHFFGTSTDRVRSPIRDSTGQSVNVDDYLGPRNSIERRLRSDSLGRLARRLQAATTLEQWKRILEDTDL